MGITDMWQVINQELPVPIRVIQGSGLIGMPNWLNVEWRKFLNDTQFFD